MSIPPKPPSPVSSAANWIFASAFFYTSVLLLILFIGFYAGTPSTPEGADLIGLLFGSILFLQTAGLWLSGILLYRRKSIGLYLWYPLSVLVIINVPLGTIFGILAYVNLFKPEARTELS